MIDTGTRLPAALRKQPLLLSDGGHTRLGDHGWLVLYFYPKDNTPGCTTESRDFNALLPEFDACDATVLVQLAEAAELLQRIFQLGISATGQLLAHASVQVETGELDQGTVEALGWLLAELGDAAAACVELAAPCRQATADFTGAGHG